MIIINHTSKHILMQGRDMIIKVEQKVLTNFI